MAHRRARAALLAGLVATAVLALGAPGAAAPAAGALPSQTSEVARATLDDTDLVPGQVVNIQGEQWRASSTVEITLHPGLHRIHVTTRPDGTFTAAFDIPADANTGTHGITIAGGGADNRYAYLQNEVTITAPRPVATLETTDLAAGQSLTIRGERWDPSGEVTITLHPSRHRVQVAPAADGTFTAAFDIPADANTGPYGITVAGVGTDGLYAYLQNAVTITAPRPVASLDDIALRAGQRVTIEGARWEPDRTVTITLYPGKHRVEVTAGPDGTFSAHLDIPGDALPGDYGITVAGVGADGLFAYLQNEVTVGSGSDVAARGARSQFEPAERAAVDVESQPRPIDASGRFTLPVVAVVLILLVLLGLLLASGHPAVQAAWHRVRQLLVR